MTTQLDDDTLQRYYDGELSPVEERVVRARVESDPEAQKRLAQLSRLSELLRTAAEDMSNGLDADALFADIQAGIRKDEKADLGTRLRVVREEWSSHRRGVVISLAAAGAVAAAALLTVLGPDAPARNEQLAANEPSVRAPAEAPKLANAPRVQGSRVENVDFGSNTGTIFEIESQGVTTAVVWISDDEGAAP